MLYLLNGCFLPHEVTRCILLIYNYIAGKLTEIFRVGERFFLCKCGTKMFYIEKVVKSYFGVIVVVLLVLQFSAFADKANRIDRDRKNILTDESSGDINTEKSDSSDFDKNEPKDSTKDDSSGDFDDGEIVVTAQRIIKKSSTGDVAIDLSEDSSVTDSVGRVVQPADWSGASFAVTTSKEMENRGARTLSEALKYSNGVMIKPSGQPGSTTSLSIRGANSGQTAVLLDGVRLNNSVTNGGSGMYDLSNFGVSGLSRATVLEGSQSAMYGSAAMGGAVDMKIKKGEGKAKTKIAQEIGGGVHMLYRTRASSEGGNDKANYYISGEWTETRGLGSSAIPSTKNLYGGSATVYNESDGLSQPTFVSRFGITPTENMELSLIANYGYKIVSIDDGAYTDSPNPYLKDQEIFIRPKLWLSTLDNLWEHELGFAYIDSQQTTLDPTVKTDSSFDARSYQVDYKSTAKIFDWNTLVAGAEYRVDTGDCYGYNYGTVKNMDKNSMYQFDLYAQDQIRLFDDSWVINFGGRIVNNEVFGVESVWHVDSIYNLEYTGTKFKGSAGTGFKTPTLYQLYGPSMTSWGITYAVGDPDLKPEESIGWDIGFEQDLLKPWKEGVLTFGATYFYNYYTNMIIYNQADNTIGFENIGKVETQGIELSTTLNITKQFKLTGGYTNLHTENLDFESSNYKKNIEYKPWNTFFFNANLTLFDEKVNLNGGIVYSGSAYADAANTKSVERYVDLSASASYQITDHFRIYGTLNNILSENIVQNLGYQSPEINGYVGLEASF